jgi:hypothetical protein
MQEGIGPVTPDVQEGDAKRTVLDVRLEEVVIDPDGVQGGWRALLVVEGVPVCTMEATGSSRPRICEWSPGGDPQDLLAVFVAVRRGDWPGITTVGGLCAGRMLPCARP